MKNDPIQNDDMHDGLPFDCDTCEAILPEAVEGLLTPAEQLAVDRHVAGCVDCAARMGEAQRGLAWLTMLKAQRPEPPAALLEKILAQTSGREPLSAPQLAVAGGEAFAVVQPAALQPAPPAGLRQTLRRWWGDWTSPANHGFTGLQPRLAMTAAMAFVSITLTLNLMGISIRDARLHDLRPATARRVVAEAQASVVRQVQGNPVVYRLESRLDDLREFAGTVRGPQPQQ